MRATEAERLLSDKEREIVTLNARLDRMQRISKQKRAEFDDLQAKLSSFNSKLGDADGACQEAEKRLSEQAEELGALRRQLEEQGSRAEEAKSASAELEATRGRVAELEKEAEAREAAAHREAATLRGKVAASERERVRAFEELKGLRSAAKERHAVEADNKRLSSELQGLREQAGAAFKELRRLQPIEAARDRLQSELTETTVMLADTEARMRQLEVPPDSSSAQLHPVASFPLLFLPIDSLPPSLPSSLSVSSSSILLPYS